MSPMHINEDVLDAYKTFSAHPMGVQILEAFYPRRYVDVPCDYMHPKYYGALWGATLDYLAYMKRIRPEVSTEEIDKVKSMGYYIGCKLAVHKVPTFLLDADMANAIVHTKPPANFFLKDLHWPYPAMLFLIPRQFGIDFIGEPTYYLSVARFDPGEKIAAPIPTPLGISYINQTKSCFGVHSCSLERLPDGKHSVSAYYFTAPIDSEATVASCMLPHDQTVYFGYNNPLLAASQQQFDQDRDGEIANRLTDLVLRIMLIMQAVPECVTHGQCVRKERREGRGEGHKQHALYYSNYIGRHFVVKRTAPSDGTGTHASPVMHWRIGHWTHQVHGPQRSLRKLIWLQPVLINKPEEKETKSSDSSTTK